MTEPPTLDELRESIPGYGLVDAIERGIHVEVWPRDEPRRILLPQSPKRTFSDAELAERRARARARYVEQRERDDKRREAEEAARLAHEAWYRDILRRGKAFRALWDEQDRRAAEAEQARWWLSEFRDAVPQVRKAAVAQAVRMWKQGHGPSEAVLMTLLDEACDR